MNAYPGHKPSETGVALVLVAAGESRRMGGTDKVFAPLNGQPLLYWPLKAVQECSAVDRVVLVVSEKNLEKGRALVRSASFTKVIDVCPGGARRQDSVARGLKVLSGATWIIVHDGARPLLDASLIERGLAAAAETGAAVAAVPARDTIKLVDGSFVTRTPRRDTVWQAQTPQVFRSDIIHAAYAHCDVEATDDASLAERAGHSVKVYHGSYDNIKVTTPEDLTLAEFLLKRRAICV